MDFNKLEPAPACELVLSRESALLQPNAKGRRDRARDPKRGSRFDEEGRVARAGLVVILTQGDRVVSEHPVTVKDINGVLTQISPITAPEPWDEAWLTDGRVRAAARRNGPAARFEGLTWK